MSIDPRDETINSDDLLSEDSSDEMKDLLKEYQLKLEQLKKKKREKKEREANELKLPQVSRSPEKKKVEVEAERRIVAPIEDKPKAEEKPKSNFLNKLLQSSIQKEPAKNINYNDRKFEFELTDYKFQPKEVNEVEPLFGEYLRKRYIPKEQVNQILSETDPNLKILKVEKLLAKTNSTNQYKEPMYTNWCLIGFITFKSDIKISQKNNSKYLKFKIGSFSHYVDLIMFDGLIDKYHKLQPGDLVIVLNPNIRKYEYKQDGQAKFGFNLAIDGDSILEIGAIRDFGYCKSIYPKQCCNVINISNQELCDIHLDSKFKKSSRMELNSVQMRSPKKRNNNSNTNFAHEKEINEDSKFYGGATDKLNPRLYQKSISTTQSKRRRLLDERANKSLEDKLFRLEKTTNPLVSTLNLSSTEKPKKPISKQQQQEHEINKHKDLLKDLKGFTSQYNKNRFLDQSEDSKLSRIEKWKLNVKRLEKIKKRSNEFFNEVNDNDDDDDDGLLILK
ncbi:unnamed protein product [Candida verbasci]|uniref:Zinc finger Mcm10/DnaG-type domain-containing protein n=1 Tax=Candida verbasci TaxID=1227364 RepID=A0A9W4TSC4_9ASCO|nr:unnamed protein product [Candida verbasci]